MWAFYKEAGHTGFPRSMAHVLTGALSETPCLPLPSPPPSGHLSADEAAFAPLESSFPWDHLAHWSDEYWEERQEENLGWASGEVRWCGGGSGGGVKTVWLLPWDHSPFPSPHKPFFCPTTAHGYVWQGHHQQISKSKKNVPAGCPGFLSAWIRVCRVPRCFECAVIG